MSLGVDGHGEFIYVKVVSKYFVPASTENFVPSVRFWSVFMPLVEYVVVFKLFKAMKSRVFGADLAGHAEHGIGGRV